MKTIDSPYAAHATGRAQGFASQRQASAVRISGQARSPFQPLWRALVLLLCALVFSPQAWALSCDIDNDGDIDLQDLALIQQAILGRATVSGPDDPRDADSNDIINSIDGRLCALRCTRARCSVTNSPPLANAGPDQRVPRGSLVALDGSASRDPEGATLNMAWVLIGKPPGSAALLAGASSNTPSFTADLAGDYVVQLVVHDGQLTSAPDMVTISVSNTPPTVSMSAPLANQRFTAPATMIVSADATDNGGQITAVTFYQGSTPIGTASSAPYRITWSPVPAGSYVLKASATDDGGATSWSDAVPITVADDTGVRVYYLHNDHLNTPRVVTDQTNRVVWRNSPLSEPFGMNPPEEDPDGDGQAFTLNLRFPGQYADRESNLHYNYYRDSYFPDLGRYGQFDPIGWRGGINGYSYVNGNPLSGVDPFGLETAIIVGGPTEGNPFGHAAIAFTGQGVYGFGTGNSLGSSLTGYLAQQAAYRNSTLYFLNTSPENEQRMVAYLKGQGPLPTWWKNPWDNCASRTQSALSSVGLHDPLPFSPVGSGAISTLLPTLPSDLRNVGALYGKGSIEISQGQAIPSALSRFNPPR